MIAKNAKNRQVLKDYLESLSEDDFIDKIIIPLFSKNGYILYTKNTHGPGEHGKDIIFYRHIPLFYDHEYVVVQAKAEKVTAANVTEFSYQLIRALRVPFPGKTNSGDKYSNYAIFMNSKDHTNDAKFEFPYLIDGKGNIKILHQDNIIELILLNDYTPDDITELIEKYEPTDDDQEKEIKSIIYSEDSQKIKFLFNTRLALEGASYSDALKTLLINYIFHKWDEDRSWEGTVQPMKWLNKHFDLIQPGNYQKLFQVFEEYTSGYPSRAARNDTLEIIRKITPEQIQVFQDKLISLSIHRISNLKSDYPVVLEKLEEVKKSNPNEKIVAEITLIQEIVNIHQQLIDLDDETKRDIILDKYKNKKAELWQIAFPDSPIPRHF